MADRRILTFYPAPGGRFNLVAGLLAWLSHGGRFELAGATVLSPFDPETHLEPVLHGFERFDPNDLDTLRPLANRHDLWLQLDAPWYTLGITVTSYHHADPPILFWSFENPFLWGRMGKGGPEEADSGLLAFARAVGAAYVLAGIGLGYEVTRHRFVRDGAGYRFVLPPHDPHRGHRVEWVDVCGELGGVPPSGFVEAGRLERPFGYVRYLVAGTEADVPSDGLRPYV